MMKPLVIDWSDIQGNIISGYAHLRFSRYLFLEITNAQSAKRWLAETAKDITSSKRPIPDAKPECAVNLAITVDGLRALGLPEEAIATFPQEFREGIHETSRSRRLGDSGTSAPENWEIGGITADGNPKEQIHVLLMLQAKSKTHLDDLQSKHEVGTVSSGINRVRVEQGHDLPGGKEHFGFQDGISQPSIAGSPKLRAGETPLATGEFILGYPNSYGNLPPTPTVSQSLDIGGELSRLAEEASNDHEPFLDLGRNGTFLVFRKLHQDVAAFRKFFKDRFPDHGEQELMMAKAVGRWPDGTPLALSPAGDDPSLSKPPGNNNFGYKADPHGMRCPIGAHIRRSNPRDSFGTSAEESLTIVNRHRIIRRGVSYGEPLRHGETKDDEISKPRGLLFFCINADIKRQFEFLQQTWINNPKFGGLYNDPDPLIGGSGNPDEPHHMTVPQDPIRTRIKGLPRFVTVKGGCYFFLPSLATLRFLAALPFQAK